LPRQEEQLHEAMSGPRGLGYRVVDTLETNARVAANPTLLTDALEQMSPGDVAEVIGQSTAETMLVVAPLAKRAPVTLEGPRRLNLGSGANRMPDAVNVDIVAHPSVDVVADVRTLPFDDASFAEVHAVNPYGFQPVSAETARVLQSGGALVVTGTPRNPFVGVLDADAAAAGFEFVGEGPMTPAHDFGVQKTSAGQPLRTGQSRTWRYRKL
jgi:hypothetical protein